MCQTQALPRDRGFVRGRAQLGKRHAGGYVHADGKPCRRGLSFVKVRALDPLAVFRSRSFRSVRITRTDDCGINELIDPLLGHEHLAVSQLHLDAVSRHDVGHCHREDIRPLLFQQRRILSCGLGLREFLCGLLPFFDLRDDRLVADANAHPVYSGTCGSWKNVLGVDGRSAAILVDLGHGYVCDHTTDVGDHISGLQRKRLDPRCRAVDQEVRRQDFAGPGPVFRLGRGGYADKGKNQSQKGTHRFAPFRGPHAGPLESQYLSNVKRIRRWDAKSVKNAQAVRWTHS